MNRALLILFSFLVIACGKSAEEQARDDVDKEMAKQQRDNPPPPPETKAAPEAPKKEKPPADPEPTTPEEVDTARKKAMIEGRDKDVIKYCEQGKLDDKTDAQVYMGCTLAACRINEADKAREWGKSLAKSKPLMEQARKVCLSNKVTI
jgi:hypothetical protein